MARHRIGKPPFSCVLSEYKKLKIHREFIERGLKRQMKEKGIIEDKVAASWEWAYNEACGTVFGFTRAEARSELKKLFNIPKKKRLPSEVQLQKVALK